MTEKKYLVILLSSKKENKPNCGYPCLHDEMVKETLPGVDQQHGPVVKRNP